MYQSTGTSERRKLQNRLAQRRHRAKKARKGHDKKEETQRRSQEDRGTQSDMTFWSPLQQDINGDPFEQEQSYEDAPGEADPLYPVTSHETQTSSWLSPASTTLTSSSSAQSYVPTPVPRESPMPTFHDLDPAIVLSEQAPDISDGLLTALEPNACEINQTHHLRHSSTVPGAPSDICLSHGAPGSYYAQMFLPYGYQDHAYPALGVPHKRPLSCMYPSNHLFPTARTVDPRKRPDHQLDSQYLDPIPPNSSFEGTPDILYPVRPSSMPNPSTFGAPTRSIDLPMTSNPDSGQLPPLHSTPAETTGWPSVHSPHPLRPVAMPQIFLASSSDSHAAEDYQHIPYR